MTKKENGKSVAPVSSKEMAASKILYIQGSSTACLYHKTHVCIIVIFSSSGTAGYLEEFTQ